MLSKAVLRISLLVLVTAFLYQGGQMSKKYHEAPTYFSTSFVDQKDARFPDITACFKSKNSNSISLKLDELGQFNYSSDDFKSLILDEPSLFNNFTNSGKWDILPYIYIRFFELIGERESGLRFSDDYPENDKVRSQIITVRRHPYYGICKTVRTPPELKSVGTYYFYASLHRRYLVTNHLIVFIHGQGAFWKTTTSTPGIMIEQHRMQVQVNYNDVRRLPIKRNDCSETTQDDCIESYLFTRLNKTFGCRPHWIDLALPFCNTIDSFNRADEFVKDSLERINVICQESCDFLDVRTGGRNHENRKNSYYFFYFPYKVPMWQENYVLNGLSFVADVGGYASILLGVSFYSFTQVIIWIIDFKIQLEKSKNENTDNEDAEKGEEPEDTIEEVIKTNDAKNIAKPRKMKVTVKEYPMIIQEFPHKKKVEPKTQMQNVPDIVFPEEKVIETDQQNDCPNDDENETKSCGSDDTVKVVDVTNKDDKAEEEIQEPSAINDIIDIEENIECHSLSPVNAMDNSDKIE